jgi:ankyrin repeat protein
MRDLIMKKYVVINLFWLVTNSIGAMGGGDFPVHFPQKIDCKNKNNKSALAKMVTVDSASLGFVKNCLLQGASVDSIFKGQSVLYRALLARRTDIANLLLDNKADIFQGDLVSRGTVLHAATSCDYGVVHRLLELGIPVDSADAYGETPLQWAVREHCYNPSSEELLEDAAEVNLLPIIKDLVHYGADPNRLMFDEHRQKTIPAMINRHYRIKKYLTDIAPHTHYLIKAIEQFSVEQVKRALLYGAEINFQAAQGNTPLHMAITNYKTQKNVASIAIVNLLLKADALLEVKNSLHETPIEQAMQCRAGRVIRSMFWLRSDELMASDPLRLAISYSDFGSLHFFVTVASRMSRGNLHTRKNNKYCCTAVLVGISAATLLFLYSTECLVNGHSS